MRTTLTEAERQTLVFRDPSQQTLDGAPARILGWANDFASVRRADGRGGVVEFAWGTVLHVVNNCDGKFKS